MKAFSLAFLKNLGRSGGEFHHYEITHENGVTAPYHAGVTFGEIRLGVHAHGRITKVIRADKDGNPCGA